MTTIDQLSYVHVSAFESLVFTKSNYSVDESFVERKPLGFQETSPIKDQWLTPWDQGEVPLRNWPLLGPKNWQLSLGIVFSLQSSEVDLLSCANPLSVTTCFGCRNFRFRKMNIWIQLIIIQRWQIIRNEIISKRKFLWAWSTSVWVIDSQNLKVIFSIFTLIATEMCLQVSHYLLRCKAVWILSKQLWSMFWQATRVLEIPWLPNNYYGRKYTFHQRKRLKSKL